MTENMVSQRGQSYSTEESSTMIHKVQAYTGDRSLTIVLPKLFSEKLGIGKGDFLKVHLENNKIVLENAEI